MKLTETLLTALMRLPLAGGLARRGVARLQRAMAGSMRRVERDLVRPRNWSNAELRRFAPLFKGAVINVSGWQDEDKQGGRYRDYFTRASGYAISNYSGSRGATSAADEVFIDLEGDLPPELKGRFQVAFNHTVLEHIYDIRKALANICALSDDAVILVTPFLQQVHYEDGSYGDYWRLTPMALERMLAEQGYSVIHQSCNDNAWYIVYIFTIAVRDPARYRDRLPGIKSAGAVGVKHFGIELADD